jgi:hypothetical protein
MYRPSLRIQTDSGRMACREGGHWVESTFRLSPHILSRRGRNSALSAIASESDSLGAQPANNRAADVVSGRTSGRPFN